MPEIHTESDDKRRKRVRECWGDREVRKGYYCATCDSGMPTPPPQRGVSAGERAYSIRRA